MSEDARAEIEKTLRGMLTNILRSAADSALQFFPLLGDDALRIVIQEMEEYLVVVQNIAPACLAEGSDGGSGGSESHSGANSTLCQSPLLNDSMVLHKTRLSRSSKSRLNVMRNTPDANESRTRFTMDSSPMEVDRSDSPNQGSALHMIDQSTFLDATGEMDDSVNERGFLADVSDMNGTVRSRPPSFNFDSISPVASCHNLIPTNCKFEYELETPLFARIMEQSSRYEAGLNAEADNSVILMHEDREMTPKPDKTILIDDSTPTNLWKVNLRPGSNRKISEEIRREIQRQLKKEGEN